MLRFMVRSTDHAAQATASHSRQEPSVRRGPHLHRRHHPVDAGVSRDELRLVCCNPSLVATPSILHGQPTADKY